MANTSASATATSGGVGVFGLLFIVLTTLKLLGKISLSWLWVTAPLWGPFAAGVVFIILFVLIALIQGK